MQCYVYLVSSIEGQESEDRVCIHPIISVEHLPSSQSEKNGGRGGEMVYKCTTSTSQSSKNKHRQREF